MKWKFLMSISLCVGLLCLSCSFAYAGSGYRAVETIIDQNGMPHQYVTPDNGAGPKVFVTSGGSSGGYVSAASIATERHRQTYHRHTHHSRHSYGSSGVTAAPTQVLTAPTVKPVQRLRSRLKPRSALAVAPDTLEYAWVIDAPMWTNLSQPQAEVTGSETGCNCDCESCDCNRKKRQAVGTSVVDPPQRK